MKYTWLLGLTILTAFAVGCAENSVSSGDDDSQLSARIILSEDHPATLDAIEIETIVESDLGNRITAMASISLEFRMHGDQEWDEIELHADGDHYAATHSFMTSGDVEFRVMGRRHSGDPEMILFESSEHMQIERAHMEMSGYKIEYEHDGGEIHEGDEVQMSFWISEDDGHGDGGHMMAGLTADFVCTEADGSVQQHTAMDEGDGRYSASHMVSSHGVATMSISFAGNGGMMQASFQVPIAESH